MSPVHHEFLKVVFIFLEFFSWLIARRRRQTAAADIKNLIFRILRVWSGSVGGVERCRARNEEEREKSSSEQILFIDFIRHDDEIESEILSILLLYCANLRESQN